MSEEEGWRQIREAYKNAKVTWGRVWHLEDLLAGLPSSPLVDALRRQLPAGGRQVTQGIKAPACPCTAASTLTLVVAVRGPGA